MTWTILKVWESPPKDLSLLVTGILGGGVDGRPNIYSDKSGTQLNQNRICDLISLIPKNISANPLKTPTWDFLWYGWNTNKWTLTLCHQWYQDQESSREIKESRQESTLAGQMIDFESVQTGFTNQYFSAVSPWLNRLKGLQIRKCYNHSHISLVTPRKTSMSPENQWLEDVSYWNSPFNMLVLGCIHMDVFCKFSEKIRKQCHHHGLRQKVRTVPGKFQWEPWENRNLIPLKQQKNGEHLNCTARKKLLLGSLWHALF